MASKGKKWAACEGGGGLARAGTGRRSLPSNDRKERAPRAGLITPLLIVIAAGPLLATAAQAETSVGQFEIPLPIVNRCATFTDPNSTGSVTRIISGELVDLDVRGLVQTRLQTSESGRVSLGFLVTAHGDGVGLTSGIQYVFASKAQFAATSDFQGSFKGTFSMDARLIGQGKAASDGVVAQGAQDNAVLHFKVTVEYAGEEPVAFASDFRLECVGSPWSNLMVARDSSTRTPVRRGFGDVWNKYAWSMKDFNGAMHVGTKNAYYDFQTVLDPSSSPAVAACVANPALPFPEIYKPLACMELFSSGLQGGGVQTRGAEIRRFDYEKKTWTRTRQEPETGGQGFRVMEVFDGKLYAVSDLGSFIMGVRLGSWNESFAEPRWDFPGARVLSSSDGRSWTEEPTCVSSGPCLPDGAGDAKTLVESQGLNFSARALATHAGKLYLGTFNFSGAEVWSFDGAAWERVQKFMQPGTCSYAPAWAGKCTEAYTPAIGELRSYRGKLMIGLSGRPADYLYQLESGAVSSAPGQPVLASTSLGVLKLFVSSAGLLYVGNVDLDNGFKFLSWDGSEAGWTILTDDGFGNPDNAYPWSMAELNGRVFLGTFNKDFFSELPRGSAEFWYTDGGAAWRQMALPLDWGPWNYGIRSMETGKGQLFLGSASNMVAPDLTLTNEFVPLSPGTEVWTVRTNAVAPRKK